MTDGRPSVCLRPKSGPSRNSNIWSGSAHLSAQNVNSEAYPESIPFEESIHAIRDSILPIAAGTLRREVWIYASIRYLCLYIMLYDMSLGHEIVDSITSIDYLDMGYNIFPPP